MASSPYRPYLEVYSYDEVCELCRKTDLTKHSESWLISHYRPPFADYFVGKEYKFIFDNGVTLYYKFTDKHTLSWSEDGEHFEEEYYEALESTIKKVFLVHHIRHNYIPFEGMTLVIDTEAELITWVDLNLGTEECDKNVRREIFFGYYGAEKAERHHFTEEMAGVILDWKYSDDFVIRHSYVTPYSATSPGEPTDNDEEYIFRKTLPAQYVKIRPGLYIVSFIEDGGSEFGLLIDLEHLHDVGALFGLGEKGLSTYTIGAVAGRGKFGFTGEFSIAYGPEPEEE